MPNDRCRQLRHNEGVTRRCWNPSASARHWAKPYWQRDSRSNNCTEDFASYSKAWVEETFDRIAAPLYSRRQRYRNQWLAGEICEALDQLKGPVWLWIEAQRRSWWFVQNSPSNRSTCKRRTAAGFEWAIGHLARRACCLPPMRPICSIHRIRVRR